MKDIEWKDLYPHSKSVIKKYKRWKLYCRRTKRQDLKTQTRKYFRYLL